MVFAVFGDVVIGVVTDTVAFESLVTDSNDDAIDPGPVQLIAVTETLLLPVDIVC